MDFTLVNSRTFLMVKLIDLTNAKDGLTHDFNSSLVYDVSFMMWRTAKLTKANGMKLNFLFLT